MLAPSTTSRGEAAPKKSAIAWCARATISSERRDAACSLPRFAFQRVKYSVVRSITWRGTWVPAGLSR